MKTLFSILSLSFLFFSCEYARIEDIEDNNTSCDTASVSFSGYIKPLLQSQCVTCHSTGDPAGGHSFDTYAGVLDAVTPKAPEDSHLYGAISHTFGPAMPQGAAKLPACDIQKVKAWILAGAKNN